VAQAPGAVMTAAIFLWFLVIIMFIWLWSDDG
jgi:hypothetical protein